MKRKANLTPELKAGNNKPDLIERYITPLLFFGINVRGLQQENSRLKEEIYELHVKLIDEQREHGKTLYAMVDKKDRLISGLSLKVVKLPG
jgi:hypothetical protein